MLVSKCGDLELAKIKSCVNTQLVTEFIRGTKPRQVLCDVRFCQHLQVLRNIMMFEHYWFFAVFCVQQQLIDVIYLFHLVLEVVHLFSGCLSPKAPPVETAIF